MKISEPKKYRVNWGVIRQNESLTSRDVGEPDFLDTPQEVNEVLRKREEWYNRMSYKLWAVCISKWDGEKYVKINKCNQPRIDVEL